jgi:anti-anti-sigma factor
MGYLSSWHRLSDHRSYRPSPPMPEPHKFELSRDDVADGVSLLVVSGEADRFRTDAVSEAIDQVRADDRDTILDISAATYLDSSMLATLVAASEQGRRHNSPLVIVCQNERLRRSLQLKGLEAILELADDRAHALELIAAAS